MHDAPLPAPDQLRLAVVGLGYVGLPLAAAFGARYDTLGFDIDPERITELRGGVDRTGEMDATSLQVPGLRFECDPSSLGGCEVFVVTVPTPVDASKRPDFSPLEAASATVGRALRRGGVVIFESTVYPGATEERCVPIIERVSGLVYRRDFHVGYSPERINPGDHGRRLPDIMKVTSGSSDAAAEFVDALYRSVVPAGTHRASSIRVAEAAKVVENIQRDVNIALMNELALILDRLGIDTVEVLEAAGTKWNFLPFRPGLVGGHCIGVDPYYLAHRAQEVGYHAELISASRRINDGMGVHVAHRVLKLAAARGAAHPRILVLGLAFKENCGDLRNTRVVDIIAEMRAFGAEVDVHDPRVDPREAHREFAQDLLETPERGAYDAVVLAVPHREFLDAGIEALRAYGREGAVIYDVKGALPRDAVDGRL
ncbi:nucleotide sugar dehydrogenase [Lysobacter xinjiangensis]|uniref:Nucleotide sugar dehydrogenase n=1 Tax=Cognatilysobacter xinjiangensis TaxID=546892 RepID=A0ABQ3BUH5_9GAMM|nr:nucleotide sugar dehydrogenase [Lysobacter xinjiangensis]GGZ57642.1 nucleotide sugar dehydrogenase [Lysobacter xinjiangensis]